MIIVIGGVAGSGKSSVGHRLAEVLGWRFLEGDSFHPQDNLDKMRRGIALEDADRAPWLDALDIELQIAAEANESIVVACSALKRTYRDRLRAAGGDVRCVLLTADQEVLRARLERRKGHFFGPALLPSQMEAFEPLGASETGISLWSHSSIDRVTADIVRWLRSAE